jgi:asparagine synthase (glutamine-hydrolysing)
MSCIAGILNRNGAAIEPGRIEGMLAPMRRRAPDGDQVWRHGSIAFGHSALLTGRSRQDACPLTLDGHAWITADARIDDRRNLVSRLRSAGRQVPDESTHAELILHAHHAFGDKLTEQLVGDFAFAIWDDRAQTLVCCRDHFGVRPFYFYETEDIFAFASDLDALLTLPPVSRSLDEVSLADFLLFGTCQDERRTIYKDVQCLPAASSVRTTAASKPQVRRYWSLPRNAETRMSSRSAYVDGFREIFEQAVADRLPDGPAALQLSGGMDSTAIAAIAADKSKAVGRSLRAYHVSCKSLLASDTEQQYAEMAASHLGIPLTCQDLGAYSLFERNNDPALFTAMPLGYGHLAADLDLLLEIERSGARVLLSGQGADSAMAGSTSYYPDLLRARRWSKFGREVAHHLRHTRSLAGMGLRSVVRRHGDADPGWTPPMPDWIAASFASRVKIGDRWQLGWQTLHNGGVDALHQLSQPWLSRTFEAIGILKMPVVVHYPFYDVRLIKFLLGVPNFMVRSKLILREAMRGKLPDAILERPKTPMPGDPVRVIVTNRKKDFLAQVNDCWSDDRMMLKDRYLLALDRYCDGEGAESNWGSLLLLAPVALNNWLVQQSLGADLK